MGRDDMAEAVVKITRWTTGHTVIEDRRRKREPLSDEDRARFEAATAMIERTREEAIARGEIDPDNIEDESGLSEGERALLARMSDVGEFVGEVIELDADGKLVERYRIDESGKRIS